MFQFVDEHNPTVSELRFWAKSGSLAPSEEWEFVVSALQPGSDLLDLVEEGDPYNFFILALYIRASELVQMNRLSELVNLLADARSRTHPWLQTWARRAEQLMLHPETYSFDAWCDGGLASDPAG